MLSRIRITVVIFREYGVERTPPPTMLHIFASMETHRLRNLLHPDLLRERLGSEGKARTTLSFYRYVRLAEVEALRHELYAEWEALGVLGRIYISQEGINAQVSLPTVTKMDFALCTGSVKTQTNAVQNGQRDAVVLIECG